MRKLVIYALLFAALTVTGSVTGTVGAQESPDGTLTPTGGTSVLANPPEPNAEAEHVVIASAEGITLAKLNGLRIDYGDTDIDLSGVSNASITTMGIDQGGDFAGARTNVGVASSITGVTVEDNTINVSVGGSHRVASNDQVVMVVGGLSNPPAGEYDVTVDVNPNSEGGRTNATLRIVGATATTTMGDTPTPGAAGTSGPGFGPVVAIVALLGIAILAARREGEGEA